MQKKIKISIITPTLNNEKDIESFLKSIRMQDFMQSDIEIIIADGGSVDKTLNIAKKYNARIINNPHVFADAGVNMGIKLAQGDLIMVLATDNIFKSKSALRRMANVFSDNSIYAAFPMQAVSRKDTIFSSYINTFTDPANHFIYGYASNPRTFEKIFNIITKNNDYVIFDFTSNTDIPLIAFAQGFTVRSDFRRSSKNAFDDVTPVLELIRKNKKIAYVPSVALYHHTINSLSHFIKKQAWRTNNYLLGTNFGISHRKKMLSVSQNRRLSIWPIYSITILPPFFYGLYYLIKDKERMWLFHPILCIISGYTSLFTLIKFHMAGNK